jgi:hypothetical protein
MVKLYSSGSEVVKTIDTLRAGHKFKTHIIKYDLVACDLNKNYHV